MSGSNWVTWYKEDSIGVITINNPPVNTIGTKQLKEMVSCLDEISGNPEVRAIVITGAGDKTFVGGADINEFVSLMGNKGEATKFVQYYHYVFNTISYFPRPIIAAINGISLGGGCELALACDLRLMSEKAKIGLPEINLGLFPGAGGTQRLPRLIGETKAKELLYLGTPISAEEAYRIGLVNHIVPHGEILQSSKALAKDIARRPGAAIKLLKQSINQGLQLPLQEGMQVEINNFDRVFLTSDVKEGVEAFFENRDPEFKHE